VEKNLICVVEYLFSEAMQKGNSCQIEKKSVKTNLNYFDAFQFDKIFPKELVGEQEAFCFRFRKKRKVFLNTNSIVVIPSRSIW